MEALKRFYRDSYYTFTALYGFLDPKIYFLVKVLNPVLQVIFFSFIAKHAYNGQDITPYIIGNAFVLCASIAFFGAGTNMINERNSGTLKNIVASPYNKFIIFVSKGVFYVFDGLITVIIGIITGVAVLGVRIPLNILPTFTLIILVTMFSACAMGLLVGSIGLVTRDINLLLNVASMSFMALSGVNFSIELLPVWLKCISNILPLTHGLKAVQVIMSNGSFAAALGLIITEAIIGVAYCIAAYVLFEAMEYLARQKASIDIF